MKQFITNQVDFDAPPDRDGAHSLKWGLFPKGTLPYWVMDMDFSIPQFMKDTLKQAVDRGFLGYSIPGKEVSETFAAWLQRHHNWQIDPEWVVWIPHVVQGLEWTAKCVCEPGDSIMMHSPIYYPFRLLPGHIGCEAIHADMVRDGRQWQIDFDSMESRVRTDTKLLYLSNPQNPTCRVYSKQELLQILDFCERHNLILCSDEVHAPFVIDEGLEHICIGSLRDDMLSKTVTLFSPGKAYNISGNCCAAAIIPDPILRMKFKENSPGPFLPIDRLNIEAVKAAYSDTTDYLPSLLQYLRGNAALIEQKLGGISELKLAPMEGTYNAYFDLGDFDIPNISGHFLKYGIGLTDGASFGQPTYSRINYATPRNLLNEGLERFIAGLHNAPV